ncbi:MAG: hypothetical protein OS112_09665 [Methanoregula sp.]|nr:MAG: hypothetical protein OS112_09665 [Methanoregula sp.]
MTDGITTVCSNCGADLTAKSSENAGQKSTTMDQKELFGRAIPFFTAKGYAVQTQTDFLIAFQSQDRDVNWFIFVILCCLGLIGAAIYYYWFTHQHQVTISISGVTDVKVIAIGNTEQAKKDAAEFMLGIR